MSRPQVIDDEQHERVHDRVAAIDVAKDSGMVCTRTPHPSRPGARRNTVWTVRARTGAVRAPGRQLREDVLPGYEHAANRAAMTLWCGQGGCASGIPASGRSTPIRRRQVLANMPGFSFLEGIGSSPLQRIEATKADWTGAKSSDSAVLHRAETGVAAAYRINLVAERCGSGQVLGRQGGTHRVCGGDILTLRLSSLPTPITTMIIFLLLVVALR